MFSRTRAVTIAGLSAALTAVPAQAGAPGDVLARPSVSGNAVAAWARALVAGDMAAIVTGCFMVSVLIALAGLRLLLIRPRPDLFLLEDRVGEELPEPETADVIAAAPARPRRLIEAITAAKAQMEISQAEKKHGR